VVGDDVEDHAQPEIVRLADELVRLLDRPEQRVHAAVVGDVVAAVRHRRRVPGRDPDRVSAQVAQVRQPRPDAGDVADAVAVAVGEAADVDLVDDGAAPPGIGRGRVAWRHATVSRIVG